MLSFSLDNSNKLAIATTTTKNHQPLPTAFVVVRDLEIDGVSIPKGTVCRAEPVTAYGMEALSLHYCLDRETLLFPDCVDSEILDALEAAPTREPTGCTCCCPPRSKAFPIAAVVALAFFIGWCLPQFHLTDTARAHTNHPVLDSLCDSLFDIREE